MFQKLKELLGLDPIKKQSDAYISRIPEIRAMKRWEPRRLNSRAGWRRGRPWMISCRKLSLWCGRHPNGCWDCAIMMCR